MKKGTKVALGMSGGVDSAVSAALLLQAGCDVVGVTCRFRDNEASRASEADALSVCERLGIPHVVHQCVEGFERCVVTPFVDDYACGLTPSPCVSCNALCKIPSLIEAADARGCEMIATGHYARTARFLESNRLVIKTALDVTKDQSYMLSLLTQDQLERLVLPLGAVTKVDVRLIAADLGLTVAEKPESQDNCFIEGDYRDFLHEKGVLSSPGDIVNCAGEIVGQHIGLWNYTVGQRKGIGIAASEPYYVTEKQTSTNRLVVGFAHEAQVQAVRVGKMNWQALGVLEESRESMVKLRYRSRAVPCVVIPCGEGVRIELRTPQPTTAAGQFAVLYEGDTVLGGGMIEGVEGV